VYFDSNQKPLAIRNTSGVVLKPDSGRKWEEAKAVWYCSLLSIVTVVDHLFNLHFFVAAQVLRACTEALPKDHRLRRAMQPFLIGTSHVNNKAASILLVDNSIIEHMTALTNETLQHLATLTYKKGPEWRYLPEHIASKGPEIGKLIDSGKLPFYEDGLELYSIYRSFFQMVLGRDARAVEKDRHLQKFWNLLCQYTDATDLPSDFSYDGLLNALANFAFHVTAQHEQVGTIIDSKETPDHGSFRMRQGQTRVDKQGYILSYALLISVSNRSPALLSNFSDFWKNDTEKKQWGCLQDQLIRLSGKIDERNKTRRYPVENANPRILECAVSV